jgi:sugar transferase (PEP-CTERM/EpsH1 system associated)
VRVLVLTHRLPYTPNRGDRLRVYHMLHHLRDHAEVELVSLVHDEEEASHLDEVRAFVTRATALRVAPFRKGLNAAMALLTKTPLTHALLDAPGMTSTLRRICDTHPPDVVFAYCSGMARFAMQPPLDHIPLVLDFVDVDSRKWRDMAAAGTPPKSWIYKREAATLGAFEARAAEHAVTSLVVNAREADTAHELAPSAHVTVLANGVELDRLRPPNPPSANPRVVFCGVMSYEPNVTGMTWFVEHVWPLVRASRPDATLAVVGLDPSHGFRSLCGSDPSITITGRVPDVREWLWDSAVGIAPLHVARGVQNKALEAIAAGLPIVITEAVAGGLPPDAASASRIASTPTQFANHVLDVLALPPMQRRALADSADLSGLAWSHTLEPLWPILQSAVRRAAAPQAFPAIAEAHP